MTDGISLTYSHDGASVATPAPQAAEVSLVAFVDCEIIPIDGQKTLAINRTNGAQKFFAPPVIEALMTCTRFDTVDGHTRRLCSQQPGLKGQEQGVRATLEGLRKEGFLLNHGQLSNQLLTQKTAKLAPSVVFIITCDRPPALERLLESMLHAGGLAAHDDLVLIDDSREQVNRESNADLVSRFNLRSAKDMVYFGKKRQEKLLEFLVGERPENEGAIRFLLDPLRWEGKKTYGRSRTIALLLSVGKRAVVLDDDILCQAIQPAIREEGIGFTGQRQAAFFADRDMLMSHASPTGFDPIAGHLEYLGQNLGYALSAIGAGDLQPQWLANANAAMLNELRAETPVLITQCGSWGDPGTGTAHWALHLDEQSIERLTSAPHGMAQALENRCSWFGCTRPTLHKMAFMSQMTGVDNSHLLPPYFPAFRGEDLLFASMVEAMYHHGAVLEYDWCVPHIPVDDRRDLGVKEPIAGEGGIVLFSRYLVESIDYKDASNPERRLSSLAENARRLADRSDTDLLLDYRREQAKGQAQLLFNLTRMFRSASELPSQNWQAYVTRAVEEIEQSLTEVHSPLDIRGIDPEASEESLIAQFRGYARDWAEALICWPALRSTAARAPQLLSP